MDLDVKTKIRGALEAVGGKHDEPEIYDGPAGDPGLAGGPGSISWEINGDLASVGAAGMAAVIMEVLHPSVMAGVSTQSTFRTQPIRRAQNTLGYVLRTTFGSTDAATKVINRVKKIHSHINGVRPDGVPYEALEPDLIAWVHTCIPWSIMEAYSRYNRPLTIAEKDRYLKEQAPIGRMGGADWVPESVAELEAFVERMRPFMSFNEQTREFVDYLAGDAGELYQGSPREQLERRLGIAASMSLMPKWARHLTGTYQPALVERLVLEPRARLEVAMIRWAIPSLVCKEMATARATGARVRSAA